MSEIIPFPEKNNFLGEILELIIKEQEKGVTIEQIIGTIEIAKNSILTAITIEDE